jgi:hypothetical protein
MQLSVCQLVLQIAVTLITAGHVSLRSVWMLGAEKEDVQEQGDTEVSCTWFIKWT